MRSFLVVSDVDSTLVSAEAIDLLAGVAGTRDRVAEITARAMRGELDFASSLRRRVATLAGLPIAVFPEVIAQYVPNPGARDLISAIHAAGGRFCAVSGGFFELLDPLARSLEIDDWQANRLEIVEGRLTGRVLGNVVDAVAKAAGLQLWMRRWGFSPADTVAIGDGANDLEMMAAAGHSIGYRPKPIVAASADVSVQSFAEAQRYLSRIEH